MENLINEIMRIANENPDGFTIYLPSLEFVKNGWVIANIATQDCFGDSGLRKALDFAMNHNRIIGGWKDGDKFYFDATIVEPNRDIAVEIMKLNKQLAIFNLNSKELIFSQIRFICGGRSGCHNFI